MLSRLLFDRLVLAIGRSVGCVAILFSLLIVNIIVEITVTSLILFLLAFGSSKSDSTVEFENPWVRIVRVRYSPHEKTRAHDHPSTPTVYVYTTDGGRLRILHDEMEKPVIRPVVKAGAVRFNRGAFEHHQVEELDGVASEYLRLELKIAPIELPAQDIRRPPDDRTPYESGMIRILRVTCAPRSLCPASAHPEDPAVIVTGKKFQWREANAPPVMNSSSAPMEQVRVELKSKPLR